MKLGNFWLFVVESQIANLTSKPSFGHNLSFKCANRSCELTLNIYVPRAFQWYKELLNPLNFYPWNFSLKIQKPIKTPIPKVEAPLGVWWFIPSHFPTFLGTYECDSRAFFLACNLASPCFGYEPKARVAT